MRMGCPPVIHPSPQSTNTVKASAWHYIPHATEEGVLMLFGTACMFVNNHHHLDVEAVQDSVQLRFLVADHLEAVLSLRVTSKQTIGIAGPIPLDLPLYSDVVAVQFRLVRLTPLVGESDTHNCRSDGGPTLTGTKVTD